jgi:hypothetical protein
MKKLLIILPSILIAGHASAQPYAYSYAPEAPPVTVYAKPYAPPPAYYPPSPPGPIAGFFGALFSIPAVILDGIAGAPVPVVPDGLGGWAPSTNSKVMPDGTLVPF